MNSRTTIQTAGPRNGGWRALGNVRGCGSASASTRMPANWCNSGRQLCHRAARRAPISTHVEAPIREAATAKAACMWAEEPLCRSMRTEAEVYRFGWRNSFDGDAAVRIGRRYDEITLRWVYHWLGRRARTTTRLFSR